MEIVRADGDVLRLIRIDGSQLIYERKDDQDRQAENDQFTRKVLAHRYVFDADAGLPFTWLYSYGTAETTKMLYLARRYRFCLHKGSCFEKVTKSFFKYASGFLLLRPLLCWFNRNQAYVSKKAAKSKWMRFAEVSLVLALSLWSVRGCI